MGNIIKCYANANAETLIACSIARQMKVVSCIRVGTYTDDEEHEYDYFDDDYYYDGYDDDDFNDDEEDEDF